MPLINLNVSCGCGAKFITIKEGLTHAVQSEHKMTVQGTIDPKGAMTAHGTDSNPQQA